MKKFLLFFLGLFFLSNTLAWSYPLKQVSKPTAKCKFNYWRNLWNDCKITLPKLTPSTYLKYKNDVNYYRRIYTILWASSYKYGWDVWNGTHLWTDFATSLWTPVYGIWPWRVVFAWSKWARWKVVIIQHRVNWKYVYSNYAHLNKIFVNFNQQVREWTKIWEVGHSWNSYWNHLHFQIDTNQSIGAHPFWFKYCGKWKSISAIVNSNTCLPEVERYTIDPLAFLESNWAIIKSISKSKVKIDRKNLVSYESIQEKIVREFLTTHKFTFKFPNAWVYYLGKYWSFDISLKDRRWKKYKDLLPEDLELVYDKRFFSSFSPRWLKLIDWIRKVTFLPKKTWTTYIQFKLWNKVIYQRAIRIVKKWQYIVPKYWKLLTFPKRKFLWMPSRGINFFQDSKFINIIKIPFSWVYYLSSTTNDIIFCKPWTNIKYLNYFKCNTYNISKNIKFTYKDTIFWIMIFKFYSNTWKPTQLLVKTRNWKTISKSKVIYFDKIKLTNFKSVYKKNVESACKKWLCLNLIDRWYIWNNKELILLELKYIVSNILNYLGKHKTFNITKIDRNKKITRIKFIEFLFVSLWLKIKEYNDYNIKYIDIRRLNKKDYNNIVYLTKLWFKWKDRFADNYFQANKNITLEEALYLTDFLISKYSR